MTSTAFRFIIDAQAERAFFQRGVYYWMEWPQILQTMQEVLRELDVEGRAEFHVVGGERFHIYYKDRFGVYREKDIPISQLTATDPAQLKGYFRSLLESYGVLSHE